MKIPNTLLFIKKHKHIAQMIAIFVGGLSIMAILTLVNHRLQGTDDTVFPIQVLPYHNVLDWVLYRYGNWSGRIFSEGLVYIYSHLPFYIWQITALLVYALFVFMTYSLYKLFAQTRDKFKDRVMLVIAFCLPFLANSSVFADGAVWMTGSIVYFWMTTIGLVALYPIIYYVCKNKKPNIVITILGILSAIVATSSQEQVGAILFGLSFIIFGYKIVQKIQKEYGEFPWYLAIFFIAITASFAVSTLAPGNKIRLGLELMRWLPDFYMVPLFDRLNYSYRWFIDALIGHTGFLLILTWLSMAALFVAKNRKKLIDYFVMFLLLALGVVTIAKGNDAMRYFFNFYADWKQAIPNHLMSFVVIPWGVVLILTLATPVLLFGHKKITGYVLSLLLMAAYAATAIMLLSPTFYASSWRSLFVPSVVLMFILYMLINKLIDTYRNKTILLAITIASLSISNYIYQVVRLTQVK